MDFVVCTTAYLGPPNREPRNLLNAPPTNPAGLGHKDPPKTKKPKNQSFTENAGTVLVFWIFVFLVFSIFGFYIAKTKKNKKPKIQKTKKPKTQKNKNPKNQNCSGILRETLVFWFFGFGSSVAVDRRNQGSNSIPLEKHEVAGGGGVLKGLVCHGGGDQTYIYIYKYTYICIYMHMERQIGRLID